MSSRPPPLPARDAGVVSPRLRCADAPRSDGVSEPAAAATAPTEDPRQQPAAWLTGRRARGRTLAALGLGHVAEHLLDVLPTARPRRLPALAARHCSTHAGDGSGAGRPVTAPRVHDWHAIGGEPALQNAMLHGMQQLVTRVDDDLSAAIDALVAQGVYASRSDAVRAGLRAIVERHRRASVAAEIVEAYTARPQTDEEYGWGDDATRRMIADEPW